MTTTRPETALPVVIDMWDDVSLVSAWREKVAKANRKADRVGLGTPYSIETSERRERVETNHITGRKITRHEARIIVTGETPSLPGWDIVAAVAWEEAGAIVNTLPGYTGPMLPTPTTKACAHCNKIRSRKNTYLVSGPDGQVEQVGRTCLTAYTGIPVGYVEGLSQWEQDSEGGYGLGSADPTYDTRSLLHLTTVVVDALGYHARSAYSGTPTSADVTLIWHGARNKYDRERLAEIENQIAESTRTRTEAEVDAEVDALLAWIADETPTSNYIQNLQTILAAEYVSSRSVGYAVSAVQAYRKHLGWVAERKVKEAAKAEAADVPTGRIVVEGTVTTVQERETQWGWTLKMRVVSPEGWAVWGSVPAAISEVKVDDTVQFTATVEASTDDPKFGFYKRPTKAEITTTTTEEK